MAVYKRRTEVTYEDCCKYHNFVCFVAKEWGVGKVVRGGESLWEVRC